MSTEQTRYSSADTAAAYVLGQTHLRPRIAVVLGSGLAGFAEELTGSTSIPYATIPDFPQATAVGHPGVLVIGEFHGIPLAVMQGRVHLFEGYSAQQVAFPTRVLGKMGVRAAILTNAAGAINTEYPAGSLVLIRDHINLQGHNPLLGPLHDPTGVRFPDMSDAYCKQYRELAQRAARSLGKTLSEGVYAAVLGPSYETPAEILYLRTIGADLVGMSTVSEVTMARYLGISVLAISCVTNMAAGILHQRLNHADVLAAAGLVGQELVALLGAVIPALASGL